MFQMNEGPLDRALRISAGVILLGLGFFSGMFAAPASFIAAGIGVVMLATGVVGTCPLYSVLGVRTFSS